MDERLDVRAVERISGQSWKMLRPQFDRINNILLALSPTARGVLTTIYIKYFDECNTGTQPFAVVWVKKSSELVVGLALSEDFQSPGLAHEMTGYKYAKLNGYFVVDADHQTPDSFEQWARQAYEHTKKEYKEKS